MDLWINGFRDLGIGDLSIQGFKYSGIKGFRDSKGFQVILLDFKDFWGILSNYKWFQGIWKDLKGFKGI